MEFGIKNQTVFISRPFSFVKSFVVFAVQVGIYPVYNLFLTYSYSSPSNWTDALE